MPRLIAAISVLWICCCGPLARSEEPTSTEPKNYDEVVKLTKQTPGYKNLQRIGLALHNYHEIYGRLPPAVLFAPNAQTYSWRVEILPLLRPASGKVQVETLQRASRSDYLQLIADCGYDITEPWDSPKNAEVLEKLADAYRHPDDRSDSTDCAYYAVVGEGTAFDPNEFTQLTSDHENRGKWMLHTLLIVESRSREPWTKPVDITYSPTGTVPRFGGITKRGFLAMTCEGVVHFVPESTRTDYLRALLSKSQDDSFVILGIPWQPR